MPTLTPRAAQGIQDRVAAEGGLIMWFVRRANPAWPGAFVAWAMVADRHGGHQQGGELYGDTLDDLRAKLPRGLTRREATPFMGAGVVEAWD